MRTHLRATERHLPYAITQESAPSPKIVLSIGLLFIFCFHGSRKLELMNMNAILYRSKHGTAEQVRIGLLHKTHPSKTFKSDSKPSTPRTVLLHSLTYNFLLYRLLTYE